MKTTILSTAVRYLTPLLILFSFFLLLRGHNEPGGGFVGGLVAASTFALLLIAEGVERAKAALQFEPLSFITAGLAIATGSGLIGLFAGQEFLKGFWMKEIIPIIGKFGTPFLFDIGVYFVVLGISLKIIFSLAEGVEE